MCVISFLLWLKCVALKAAQKFNTLSSIYTCLCPVRKDNPRVQGFGTYFWLCDIFDKTSLNWLRARGHTFLSCDNLPGRLPANQPGSTGDRSIGSDIQDKLGESDSKSGDRVSNLSVTHIWPGISRIRLNLSNRLKPKPRSIFAPNTDRAEKQNL